MLLTSSINLLLFTLVLNIEMASKCAEKDNSVAGMGSVYSMSIYVIGSRIARMEVMNRTVRQVRRLLR